MHMSRAPFGGWGLRLQASPAPPLWKGASPRVVECCRVARQRPESLVNGLPARLAGRKSWARPPPPLERGLSTRRRTLSGGPKWLIVRGVLRTRPPNRDILGFGVLGGAEGISRAWQKRFVQKRPPPPL